MKAFVTNRIGDAGFLIGIFILFTTFGSVNFADLAHLVPQVPEVAWTGTLTVATLFLFLGATGKSAKQALDVVQRAAERKRAVAPPITLAKSDEEIVEAFLAEYRAHLEQGRAS